MGRAGLAVGKRRCGQSPRRPPSASPAPVPFAARPPPAPRLLGLLVGSTVLSVSPRSCCSAPPALGLLSWPPFTHLSGSQQEFLVQHMLALTLERPRRCLSSLGEGGTRCDRGSFPWGLGGSWPAPDCWTSQSRRTLQALQPARAGPYRTLQHTSTSCSFVS